MNSNKDPFKISPELAKAVLKHLSGDHRPSILVMGDYMLDQYMLGDVERISPEAPIPVLLLQQELNRLGGTGNVVHNLCALEMNVHCYPVLGEDFHAQELKKLFEQFHNFEVTFLKHPLAKTIVKTRVVARKQQLVRIDRDPYREEAFPSSLRGPFLKLLENNIENFQAFIFSDYGKGFYEPVFFNRIAALAHKHSIPLFIDPKLSSFEGYAGCFAITPNIKEAMDATGIAVKDDPSAEMAAKAIAQKTGAQEVYLTRSEHGITVFHSASGDSRHFPALKIDVTDVSGAGDTVIATLAWMKALGFSCFDAAQIANLAASIVVGHFGTIPCSKIELLTRLQEIQSNSWQSILPEASQGTLEFQTHLPE